MKIGKNSSIIIFNCKQKKVCNMQMHYAVVNLTGSIRIFFAISIRQAILCHILYLSKTPFLTFVYRSKCNINLPCFIGNSKKGFLWTGLVFIHFKWWSDTPQSVLKYKCLDLLVYALTYAVLKRHSQNAHICINRIYQYADYVHVETIYIYTIYMRIFWYFQLTLFFFSGMR